jgi:hypothetical protein
MNRAAMARGRIPKTAKVQATITVGEEAQGAVVPALNHV